MVIANDAFVFSLDTHKLRSSLERNGFLAWKSVFRLKDKIYINKEEKEYYNISEVTIYVDANTGDPIAYDWK